MSITLFFVDAFTSALDRGIASANDIIRHVTPEVLSIHLPRNLWARLLTACLGASRVDATTIVDTVGIPNLCEHMPKPLLWTCLADIAAVALGGARLPVIAPAPAMTTASTASMPPATTFGSSAAAAGMATTIGLLATTPAPAVPSSPSSAASAKPARGSSPDMLLPPPPASTRPPTGPIEAVLPPPPDAPITDGGRAPTRPPVRGLGTSRIASAAGASSRRPQAGVQPTGPGPAVPSPRSTVTPTSMPAQTPRRDDLDFEIETDLRADWKGKDPIPVDDEQLVDWSANEETSTGSSFDRNKR